MCYENDFITIKKKQMYTVSSSALNLEVNYESLDKHEKIAFLKQQQQECKKQYPNSFLFELEEVLEKCFATVKKKKEHFITVEKLTLDLLKLLQKQKHFKDSDSYHKQVLSLAVYDNETFEIGKIIKLNLEESKVEFLTYLNSQTKKTSIIKNFNEVSFFDFNSIQLDVFYQKQRKRYDGISYKETFCFLSQKTLIHKETKDNKRFSSGGGVKLERKLDLESDVKDQNQ